MVPEVYLASRMRGHKPTRSLKIRKSSARYSVRSTQKQPTDDIYPVNTADYLSKYPM
jgi:hypothetical protein